MTGWIKLHRSLTDWEWWDDHNATRLLVCLLCTVNYKPKKWKGIMIQAGSMVTSFPKLAEKTGLTIKQTRGAMQKLENSGEVARSRAHDGQLVTLRKWDKLQADEDKRAGNRADEGQMKGRQRATTKEGKEGKEEKDYVNFTIDECLTYLNKKAGSQFKISTEAHRKYIGGRLGDGATIEQLKAVIDFKVREWSNDPKMSKYLRPATLFQPEKFDGYLAETNRTGPGTSHLYDHTRIKEHETYMDRVKRNRIDPRDTDALKVFVDEEDKHPTTVKIIQDRYKSNPEEFPYVKN